MAADTKTNGYHVTNRQERNQGTSQSAALSSTIPQLLMEEPKGFGLSTKTYYEKCLDRCNIIVNFSHSIHLSVNKIWHMAKPCPVFTGTRRDVTRTKRKGLSSDHHTPGSRESRKPIGPIGTFPPTSAATDVAHVIECYGPQERSGVFMVQWMNTKGTI